MTEDEKSVAVRAPSDERRTRIFPFDEYLLLPAFIRRSLVVHLGRCVYADTIGRKLEDTAMMISAIAYSHTHSDFDGERTTTEMRRTAVENTHRSRRFAQW